MQFVVQASLALFISALSMFSNAVHDVAQSIQATVNASVDAINATLKTTLTGFNDILEIVGKSIPVPTVPYPNLRLVKFAPEAYFIDLYSLSYHFPPLLQRAQ